MIQGPNQVALHHVEVAPPIAAAAAIIEVPNVVLPNLPQPPIPAPELAPVPMVIPPAANDNPIHLRLMRTLYGFPDIQMEEEHGEGEDAQDSDDGGA
ncbi:hypothetical protein FRC12_012158 [Ceratobasidium sp. 428]|nr:hypothetical protein FRC12_012158 [Ceratobasidium sp. 428]